MNVKLYEMTKEIGELEMVLIKDQLYLLPIQVQGQQ